MHVRHAFFTILTAAALLTGCDSVNDGLADQRRGEQPRGASVEDAQLSCGSGPLQMNAYEVVFLGRVFEGGNTTFSYQVSRTKGKTNLNYFFLEVPELGSDHPLVSYSPANAAKLGLNRDEPSLYGITWEPSVTFTAPQVYSYTFAGNVGEGCIRVASRSGNKTAPSGELTGPGVEDYSISGHVFIDSDADGQSGYGTFEAKEFGLGSVVVSLFDGASQRLAMDTTGADGSYAFGGLAGGTYTVVVENSADNALLYRSAGGAALYTFTGEALVGSGTDAGGGAAITRSVGPSAQGVAFGFALHADGIVAALGSPEDSTKNALRSSEYAPLLAGLLDTDDVAGGAGPYVVAVNDFRLQFRGRHYDETRHETTYHYRIEGTGAGRDVSHSAFEVSADCTPVSYAPENVTLGHDPTTGVSGVKFNVQVRVGEEKDFTLTFAGRPDPGVIDVALKNGTSVGIARMPGACMDAVGTTEALVGALEDIFSSGPADADFLYLQRPLSLTAGDGGDVVLGAFRIMTQEVPEQDSRQDLEQLLLGSQIIFKLGLGTRSGALDASIFQYVEPIIDALYGPESTVSSAAATSKTTSGRSRDFEIARPTRMPHAGTGSTSEGGSVLRSYF